EAVALLKAKGIPAELDTRNEKIGFKVREHSKAKTARIWVVGEKEAEERKVAIRSLGSKETQELGLEDAVEQLFQETRAPI
ncbi:MAG TPA: threonine--tRNA ligase, partial [Alcanivorax sp.]|nr:threonine--tRNA ligase [Alcanivorax sp.]